MVPAAAAGTARAPEPLAGIVYDAKKPLADVAAMVEKQKAERAAARKAPAGS